MRILAVGTGLVVSMIAIAAVTFHGVSLEASIDRDNKAANCPPSHPIYVGVRNWTLSEVRSVRFRMELYEGNISNNLMHHQGDFRFNHTVAPLASNSLCYSDGYISDRVGTKHTVADTQGFAKISLSEVMDEVDKVVAFTQKHRVVAFEAVPEFF